jgi:hypothetical protein
VTQGLYNCLASARPGVQIPVPPKRKKERRKEKGRKEEGRKEGRRREVRKAEGRKEGRRKGGREASRGTCFVYEHILYIDKY